MSNVHNLKLVVSYETMHNDNKHNTIIILQVVML